MKNKTYSEKLLDPSWQKKRLEILQRDNFTCQNCYDKDNELHIHHLKYNYNSSPWDIEDKYLLTLCKDCHNSFTEENNKIKQLLSESINIEALTSISEIIDIFNNTNPGFQDDIVKVAKAFIYMDYKYKKALMAFINEALQEDKNPF